MSAQASSCHDGSDAMTTPTIRDVEHAICCPGGCRGDIRHMCTSSLYNNEARAVAALYAKLWREYPRNAGPMVVTRVLGEGGDVETR